MMKQGAHDETIDEWYELKLGGWESVASHDRQKLKKLRTQIYMDLRYIDPQARVLNYFYK